MKKEQAIKNTQGIIKDFKVQSFAIKGFSLTFLGLLIQPYYENPSLVMCVIYLLAILVFWYLDSFYLMMERKYRVVESCIPNKDSNEEVSLSYKDYKETYKVSLCNVIFSQTIFPIYTIQIILVVSILIAK